MALRYRNFTLWVLFLSASPAGFAGDLPEKHPLWTRDASGLPHKEKQDDKTPAKRSDIPAEQRFLKPEFSRHKEKNWAAFYVARVPEIVHPGQNIAGEDFLQTKFGPTISKSPNLKLFFDPKEPNGTFVSSNYINPFVLAGEYAFAHHRPFVLSVDHIWLLILQGLSVHISQNPELHRKVLVEHKGKMRLRVLYDDRKEINWEETISGFSQMISQNSRGLVRNLNALTFSTTSKIDRIAHSIAIMDALKEYYDYETYPICGIPYFILKGSPEDWQKLIVAVNELRALGLDWWVDAMKPVLTQIAAAAAGKIDQVFWDDFITIRVDYGRNHLNGWFNVFFPYLVQNQPKEDKSRKEEDVVTSPNATWQKTTRFLKNEFKEGHELGDFPTGLSMVQVKHQFRKRDKIKAMQIHLISGFIGLVETPGKELEPVVGWLAKDAKLPLPFLQKGQEGRQE